MLCYVTQKRVYMFERLKQKKKDFDDKAFMVMHCQHENASYLLQTIPYNLIFKTTHWCWNNCAHCCESSGTNMPKTFIPESVINGYIDEAVKDKNFTREVVFTGGEITSAYRFAGRNYVRGIIIHTLKAGCSIDIKTNAGFVNSPLAKTVYYDIEDIVRNQFDVDTNGIKRLVPFQVSLSLDRFHRDAMERDFKFIEYFANTNIPGVAFTINVSSVYQDKSMFPELMHKLMCSGVKVSELFLVAPHSNNAEQVYDLNGNVIIRHHCGTLFNGGRAKDMKYAQKVPFPQFNFVDPDGTALIAFDSFGNVTLGENSGKKISVPWRNNETGQPVPLQTIRDNLIVATKSAEQDFLKEHKKMDAYFRWTTQFIK